MKILLVDDDNAVRNVLSKFLSEENCLVRTAGNGREAFALLEQDLPDAVMSDIKMPEMDGLELLKASRRKYEVPFIMFTGYADMEIAVEALNSGAYYFIHKPINFYEIMAVLNNLRERIVLRRRIEEQRAGLFNMSRLADLGLLTAGLVHEVGAPVEALGENLERLQRKLGELEQALGSRQPVEGMLVGTHALVESMRGHCRGVSDIVHGMGLFTGRMSSMERQSCDLNECLEDALRLVEPGSIELERNLGPAVLVRGSKLYLSQLVTNLLTNACEALEGRDQGKITIGTCRDEDWVFLQVADNGPGIGPEQREKVFTPFFTTREGSGHKGLGLSIAYGIVAASGGEINFRNPDSGGTIFTVRLPGA